MRKMGTKQLILDLHQPLIEVPDSLSEFALSLSADGSQLVYTYDTRKQRTGITTLLKALADAGIKFRDLQTEQSSLEDIFVNLVQS